MAPHFYQILKDLFFPSINLYCKYIKEEKYELANSICIHYFVFLRIIYCWSSSYQRKVLISSINDSGIGLP